MTCGAGSRGTPGTGMESAASVAQVAGLALVASLRRCCWQPKGERVSASLTRRNIPFFVDEESGALYSQQRVDWDEYSHNSFYPTNAGSDDPDANRVRSGYWVEHVRNVSLQVPILDWDPTWFPNW